MMIVLAIIILIVTIIGSLAFCYASIDLLFKASGRCTGAVSKRAQAMHRAESRGLGLIAGRSSSCDISNCVVEDPIDIDSILFPDTPH